MSICYIGSVYRINLYIGRRSRILLSVWWFDLNFLLITVCVFLLAWYYRQEKVLSILL